MGEDRFEDAAAYRQRFVRDCEAGLDVAPRIEVADFHTGGCRRARRYGTPDHAGKRGHDG